MAIEAPSRIATAVRHDYIPGNTMPIGIVEIPGYVTGTWKIDPAHSEVSFTVRHLAVSKVRGRFTEFEGSVVTAEDPRDSSVTATVDLASVHTGNAQRDAHLRTAEFLDVESHPTMTYRSTGLRVEDDGAFVLDGELTLRGTTLPVPLTLEPHGFGPDPFLEDPTAGSRFGLTATGAIDRTDFGITTNSPIPGGVLISERVELTLEIQAALEPRED